MRKIALVIAVGLASGCTNRVTTVATKAAVPSPTPNPALDSVEATVDCNSFASDDKFLSYVVLPKKLKQPSVTVVDAERTPHIRSTSQYLHHKIIYFSTTANIPGTELRLTTDGYIPYLSNAPYQTIERQTVSPTDNYRTGSYREIFIVTADRTAMYSSLFSQPGEMSPGASSAAQCAAGQFNTCDHVVVAGQAWAWNLSGSALASSGNVYPWTNSMQQAMGGGYYYNMNLPTSLGFTQYFYQTTTFAQMSFLADFDSARLGNMARTLGQSNSPITPFQGIRPTVDLQSAFMAEHYSGCDANSLASLGDRCTVYEAHLYGQTGTNNVCHKKMPLGLVGIFIGTTKKANGVGTRIDQGIATYEVY